MDSAAFTARLTPTIVVADPTGTTIHAGSTTDAIAILSQVARHAGRQVSVDEIDADQNLLSVVAVSKSGDISSAIPGNLEHCEVVYTNWTLTLENGSLSVQKLAESRTVAQQLADKANQELHLIVDRIGTASRGEPEIFTPSNRSPEPDGQNPEPAATIPLPEHDLTPITGMIPAYPSMEPRSSLTSSATEGHLPKRGTEREDAVLDEFAALLEDPPLPTSSSALVLRPRGTLQTIDAPKKHRTFLGKTGKTKTLIVAGVLSLALLGAGTAAMAHVALHDKSSITSDTTTAPVTQFLIAGWSPNPAWQISSANGTKAATSSDGRYIAFLDKDSHFTIIDASKTTNPVATGPATTANPLPVVVDDKSGFLVLGTDEIQLWVEGATSVRTIKLSKEQKIVIRSGRPFITGTDYKSDPNAITPTATTPFQSPEERAVPVTLVAGGKMTWAATGNRLLTANPDGKKPSGITLAQPSKAGALTRIVAIDGATVISVWGGSTLALHDSHNGTLISSTTIPDQSSAPTSPLTAPGAKLMVFAGKIVNLTTNKVTDLAPSVTALSIIGDNVYGTTKQGRVLITPTGTTETVPPAVTPAGIDNGEHLIITTKDALIALAKEPKK